MCAMQHADRFLGCEDMHLVTLGERTVIFAACLSTPSDRARVFSEMRPADTARRIATNASAPADKIFRWDLDSDDVAELSLSGFTGDAAFHGFDINQLPDGTLSLYAINHALSGSSIEKFTHDPSTTVLSHTKSIPAPADTNPNDIYALPHLDAVNAFYITSDHRYNTGFPRFIEDYTRRPWGSVRYHSGENDWTVALPHVAGANGITGDKRGPGGGRIYVSALLTGEVVVADEDSGVVAGVQRVPLGFMGDNVALTAEGTDLYVAGHAMPQVVGKHVEEGLVAAGSMVARIGTAQLGSGFFGGGFTAVPNVEEVLVDVGGRWVNASTTAVFRARGEGGEEGDLYVTGLTGRGEFFSFFFFFFFCVGVG